MPVLARARGSLMRPATSRFFGRVFRRDDGHLTGSSEGVHYLVVSMQT